MKGLAKRIPDTPETSRGEEGRRTGMFLVAGHHLTSVIIGVIAPTGYGVAFSFAFVVAAAMTCSSFLDASR